ncbi:efflux RND transporter periplasmic adaptor subunit [Roseibacterium sp. SDUM158017]|uniref:efflux RND transporter periplasmic adaptor subunit n=1 Tax=Roseicyclus salinarum TaxID=3036773 RepID=UPI002414DA66|nr:efflux RND transporter periplasmic adaptor subunit [Roseibacterium sp. SDUM158017]MDG4650396.1 efflux RND transporter periplasmic adaptor subunit [Roseibacterium sp. SDUM158017]
MKDPASAETAAPEAVTSDRGASRSTWIATGITLAIVLWMASGIVFPSEAPQGPGADAPAPVAVAVERSQARSVTLIFNAEGQALPDRDTLIRAEASGDVAEVFVSLGDTVEEGAQIGRLRSEAAEANLAQARQELAAARRDLENAETLLERGVATVDRLQQTRTAFTQAQSRLTAAEEAVSNNVITAPFAGRIEALDIDPGEFVQLGAQVGRIVDITPLTVAFQVPQQALNRLSSGQTATVTFITGEVREGTVTFVGGAAASATRTFTAEISIPNPDGAIAAGISAEIAIPTNEVMAHFVSPSLVSLDADGRLGVKTVDDADVVHFYPIEIVRAEIDGIWVTGLPETARLITVGQGFVGDGETVRPQTQDPTR